MIEPLNSGAALGPPASSPSDPPATPKSGVSHREASAEADVRLSIAASPEGTYFVYTLQDRSTGRIIAQLPRQTVEAIGAKPDYKAGDVVRARA